MAKDQTYTPPDPMTGHLFQWLRPVDRQYTKKISGKSYSGDSVNPTWVIMRLTEALGPIGETWGFTVVKETIHNGRPHQVPVEEETRIYKDEENPGGRVQHKRVRYQLVFEQMHQVEIEFWRIVDGERHTFSAFGGTPLLYVSGKGKWIHDEDAAKKSLTDAYVKAASWLGVAADIFLGLFDDKYSGQPPERDGDMRDVTPGSAKLPPSDSSPQERPAGTRQASTPDW